MIGQRLRTETEIYTKGNQMAHAERGKERLSVGAIKDRTKQRGCMSRQTRRDEERECLRILGVAIRLVRTLP